jgi:hypothetical protein
MKQRYADLSVPIVDMHKLECTRAKVQQLASTRAISAHTNAWLNIENPGHP